MTDVATEDVYAHGAEGLPGCSKPMIAVTHLFSSLYQLNFFIKQLVNVREQIP